MQYSFTPRPQAAIDMIVSALSAKDLIFDLQAVAKGVEVMVELPTTMHQSDFELAFNMGRVVGALEVEYQITKD